MWAKKSLFRKELPCIEAGALSREATPECLKTSSGEQLIKQIRCSMCDKLKVEINSFRTQAYKAGYDYVALIIRKGPRCELVTFAVEPDEKELRERYGKDLLAVVPLSSQSASGSATPVTNRPKNGC